MKIEETLLQRGAIYGDYSRGIKLEACIMGLIKEQYQNEADSPMHEEDVVAISKIVMKLSRIAVSPDHIESWHDIAGYAKLQEDHLTKENKNAKS